MDETGSVISALSALTGIAEGDLLTIVDISDSTMSANGTNKKLTIAELLSYIFSRTLIDASEGTDTTYGTLSGSIDGSNTTFTVSNAGYLTGKLEVYLNGQLQTQGSDVDWEETSPANGTFDFNTAPESGDIIIVKYLY